MSTKKSMLEVSVQELICNYNLIVPEIQREYVWGFNDYGILDTFITDIKEGFKNSKKHDNKSNNEIDTLKSLIANATDATTIKSLSIILEGLTEKPNPLNIGFLYSYRPDYYVFNDRNEDLFLIDGQQRFTTLFLILYYLSIKENKQEDFIALFRFDDKIESIAFDYRVRTLTHNFFIDLISNTKSIDDLLNIRSKNWFLSNYDNDVTVQSIVGKESKENSGVFQKLNHYFKNENEIYYEFVKTQIKFWHFKTEETSQGEELYITMNSRGQQLADNETIRARLFDDDVVKANQLEWSEKWEIWQDFFWKHRDKKNKEITADEGFNEFLRWIQIIKMTELQEIVVDDENEEALDKKDIIDIIKWGKGKKLNVDYLQLPEIENYFNALKYLFVDFNSELETLKGNYSSYTNFDLIDSSWLSPTENNNSIVQIDCFRLLPILYYCKERLANKETINSVKLFRIIRYFYNLRKDTTVFKTASMQCVNGLKLIGKLDSNSDITDILSIKGISSSLINTEEKLKLNILKTATNRFKNENLFWRAEDINQNKGEISHLVNLTNSMNSENQLEFNLVVFEDILKIFEELIEKRYYIFGDLIINDVYKENTDRVFIINDWHKCDGFMDFVSYKYLLNDMSLKDFLIQMQKSFVKKYDAIENIKAEKSFKNQIYIYYIIQRNILQDETNWTWDFGLNFGAWEKYLGPKSLFDDKYIYQQYDKQWRENENKILWLQRNLKNKTNLLEKLLIWSKE